MNVLLCITGSIAAYKSLDLCRSLVKEGHQVRVILTQGALNFIVPEVFSYLGAQDVYLPQDDFRAQDDQDLKGPILHIALRDWADKLVISPASANTLSRLARAEANDLLGSVFLAWNQERPIIIFPAMNTKMLHHPFVSDCIKKLSSLDSVFIHPSDQGLLACQEIGEGKLPSIELIHHFIESFTLKESAHHVLISTGATISPIDSVRYLTNSSSGKTGLYFAKESLAQGHHVTVIAGLNATKELDFLSSHPRYQLKRVTSTKDMEDQIDLHFPKAQLYISSAAINDIEFSPSLSKLKKESLESSLPIYKTTDILKKVLTHKDPSQRIIGFAAETNISKSVLQKKWNDKQVDLLIGTKVNNGMIEGEKEGFQNELADYSFFKKDHFTEKCTLSKKDLAKRVLTEFRLLS